MARTHPRGPGGGALRRRVCGDGPPQAQRTGRGRPASGGDPPELADWRGPAGPADAFRAHPLGAVLLSAVYGVERGRLRACRACWRLFVPPWRQGARRRCDACRALGGKTAATAYGLPRTKALLWRRVLDRMHKRGFPRLGLTTREARRRWKEQALQALHAVTTPHELRAWEDTFAPPGRPGRPRRDRHTRGRWDA